MFWPGTAAGTSASLCPTSLDMLWLFWAGRRKLFTLIIRDELWPMLTTHRNCRQKVITLIMSWISGRIQAQTVQVLFTIYTHVEGKSGFPQVQEKREQINKHMWACGTSQADTGTTTDYSDQTTLLQIDDTVPTSQTQSWLESHSHRHLDTKKNNIQEEIPTSFCISPLKHFTKNQNDFSICNEFGLFHQRLHL